MLMKSILRNSGIWGWDCRQGFSFRWASQQTSSLSPTGTTHKLDTSAVGSSPRRWFPWCRASCGLWAWEGRLLQPWVHSSSLLGAVTGSSYSTRGSTVRTYRCRSHHRCRRCRCSNPCSQQTPPWVHCAVPALSQCASFSTAVDDWQSNSRI